MFLTDFIISLLFGEIVLNLATNKGDIPLRDAAVCSVKLYLVLTDRLIILLLIYKGKSLEFYNYFFLRSIALSIGF